MKKLLALLAICAMPPDTPAGWGLGGCGAVGPAMSFAFRQAKPKYVWKKVADAPNQRALYRDGKHIGSYDVARGFYRPRLGPGRWGKVGEPPVKPPKAVKAPEGDEAKKPTTEEVLNFGINTDKLRQGPPYSINGRPVSREQAKQAIESGVLDDTLKPHLTIIGPPEARKPVLAELSPEIREKVKVQAYDPAHWSVKDAGFVTTGSPTIYFQAPDGKVLHRQDDYVGGAPALATAIRKADPGYKPPDDPDMRKPPLIPGLPALPWSVYAIAAALGLIVLTPRRLK